MTGIIPLNFDGKEVRAVLIEGEPHFVGKDVAGQLGYVNETDAMNKHCRGVAKRYPIADALGRKQDTRVLTEPDVLRLIISSKLPAAERFERWVFEEVLPAIRKTGSYGGSRPLSAKETGGIVKAVVASLVGQLREEMLSLAAGFDPEQAVVDGFRPMLDVLIERGVGQKKRRNLSSRCSKRCARWLLMRQRGADIRVSRETKRFLFQTQAVEEWLRAEGSALIRDHKEAVAGQGVMNLPRPKLAHPL